MNREFEHLVSITDANYQVDLARLKAISAEELSLRRDLEDLREKAKTCEELALSDGSAMRLIGGDILWRAWVERKQKALSRALAETLARKQGAIQELTRSFGKNAAAQKLCDHQNAKLKSEREKLDLSKQQLQMVLSARQTGL